MIIKKSIYTPKHFLRSWPQLFWSLLAICFASRKKAIELKPFSISVNDGCDCCNLCVRYCPVKAISIESKHLNLDQTICIECDLCLNVCPQKVFEKIISK